VTTLRQKGANSFLDSFQKFFKRADRQAMKYFPYFLKQIGRRYFSLRTRQKIKAYLARSIGGSNLLGNLSNAYMSDKNNGHSYTSHYQAALKNLRKKPVVVLEIGIGGYDDPNAGGASLRMWKDFFPKGKINGIDLFPKTGVDEQRIRTFQGSQDDGIFLENVINEIGNPDIIIDDGSHINKLTKKTFEILFPKLKMGGFYIIEDLQTSYWPQFAGVHWGGSFDKDSKETAMSFFKSLVDCVNQSEFIDPLYVKNYYDLNIVGISFFHNICIIQKNLNSETSNMVGRVDLGTVHPQPN
jgi:hypothetical protein